MVQAGSARGYLSGDFFICTVFVCCAGALAVALPWLPAGALPQAHSATRTSLVATAAVSLVLCIRFPFARLPASKRTCYRSPRMPS